ncbi:MAG: transglutaminase-like domain-containing protein [bacterium]
MPKREGLAPIVKSKEIKSVKEIAPLGEQVGLLLNKITELNREQDRSQIVELAARVFENSVEDGLKLAEKLRLTPIELQEIIKRKTFIVKHGEFYNNVVSEIMRKEDIKNEHNLDQLIALRNDYRASRDNFSVENFLAEEKKQQQRVKLFAPEIKDVSRELDQVYAQYLAQRELASTDQPQTGSQGEVMARQNLLKAERYLNENYFSGPAKKLITTLAVEQGISPAKVEQALTDITMPDFWSLNDIEEEIKFFKINISREEIKKRLKGQEYVSVVYGFEKKFTETQLVNELNKSLVDTGQRIELNSKTDKFEVTGEKKKEEKQKEKENLEAKVFDTPTGGVRFEFASYRTMSFEFYKEKNGLWNLEQRSDVYGKDIRPPKFLIKDPFKYFDIKKIQDINLSDDGKELGVVGFNNNDEIGAQVVKLPPETIEDLKKAKKIVAEIDGESAEQRKVGEIQEIYEREVTEEAISFEAYPKIKFQFLKANDFDLFWDGWCIPSQGEAMHLALVSSLSVEDFVKFIHVAITDDQFLDIYGENAKENTTRRRIQLPDNIVAELKKAKERADQIEENSEAKEFDLEKFEEKSLDYIEKLLKAGADKNLVATGLAGLDSERAWQMRDQFLKDGADEGFVARGLAGLDSERAWQMRKQLLKDSADKGYVALGLAGLNSEQAWQMRERFLKDGVSKEFVAIGLAGLDSEQSWQMRDQLLKDGASECWVAMGLAGDETTFVWRLKYQHKKSESPELSPADQQKLDLLNLVHQPTAEGIEAWQKPATLEKKFIDAKKSLSSSPSMARRLTEALKSAPKSFLDYMGAKSDKKKTSKILARRLAEKIFPEAFVEKHYNGWGGYGGFGGGEGGRGETQPKPADYLSGRASFESFGGGREQLNDTREIMEFRHEINCMVIKGLYGDYDENSNRWNKLHFALNNEMSQSTLETTVTLPDVGKNTKVNLPHPLYSQVIKERVKGIDSAGLETPIEAVTEDSLGEVTAENKSASKKLAYSMTMELVSPVMADVSGSDYEQFAKKFKIDNGAEMNGNIAELNDDIEIFCSGLKDLSPKEKVVRIESYVRQIGFYDEDNQEVSQLKRGKSLEEKFYIMEQRLEELRAKYPDWESKLAGKKYAGVCADFAELTTAMLRRAGLEAGIARGFIPEGKKVMVRNAHAASFVVWPTIKGKNEVFIVDGTPNGLENIAGQNQPSILEREQISEQLQEQASVQALEKLKEVEKLLASHDTESIKKLTNGELEKVLNAVLSHEVKQDNFQVLERLFDTYWYTAIPPDLSKNEHNPIPLYNLDLNNPDQKNEVMLELAGAVKRIKNRLANEKSNNSGPAGTKLLKSIEEFADKFVNGRQVGNKAKSLELMQSLVDLIKNDLSPVEQRSAVAVLTYLKAQNMSGKAR